MYTMKKNAENGFSDPFFYDNFDRSKYRKYSMIQIFLDWNNLFKINILSKNIS